MKTLTYKEIYDSFLAIHPNFDEYTKEKFADFYKVLALYPLKKDDALYKGNGMKFLGLVIKPGKQSKWRYYNPLTDEQTIVNSIDEIKEKAMQFEVMCEERMMPTSAYDLCYIKSARIESILSYIANKMEWPVIPFNQTYGREYGYYITAGNTVPYLKITSCVNDRNTGDVDFYIYYTGNSNLYHHHKSTSVEDAYKWISEQISMILVTTGAAMISETEREAIKADTWTNEDYQTVDFSQGILPQVVKIPMKEKLIALMEKQLEILKAAN